MSFVTILGEMYRQLLENAEGLRDEDLAVSPVPNIEGVYLGLSRGSLCLILPDEFGSRSVEQELEHLTIRCSEQFDVLVRNGEIPDSDSFVSIRTRSLEPWLISTFLQLVGSLLDSLGSDGERRLAGLVHDLVDLFRALVKPASRDALGLWGELFVLSRSIDVDLAVSSWHSNPQDRFDFSRGRERVEVKTTTGPRIHAFSHDQLESVPGRQVTVVSIITSGDPEGVSCGDLVSLVLDRIESGVLVRSFLNQVIQTLGDTWANQGQHRFSREDAMRSIRFFDSAAIPKVEGSIPLRVSAVRYRSDLQEAEELNYETVPPDAVLLRSIVGVA